MKTGDYKLHNHENEICTIVWAYHRTHWTCWMGHWHEYKLPTFSTIVNKLLNR